MKDRNVEFPQRYRLQKVGGTDDIYDIIPAPGDVADEGTLVNKNTLLKDATADLFGLGTDAVPDDALRVLSRFQSGLGNEHLWSKIGKSIALSDTSITRTTGAEFNNWIYSDSVSISGSEIVMNNPVTVTPGISPTGSEVANIITNKYVIVENIWSEMLFVVFASYDSSTDEIMVTGYSPYIATDYVEYLNSPYRDTYPPIENDGYIYTYLGLLGAKTQIATGSYDGTGVYGASNLNSLAFPFVPKLLLISNGHPTGSMLAGNNNYTSPPWDSGAYIDWEATFIAATSSYEKKGGFYAAVSGRLFECYATFSQDKKTINWYTSTTDASKQLNSSGTRYYYFAIG